MFDDTYKMLSAPGDGLYKEKGSKFIATAFTVTSEEEVKQALAEVKKKYYDARHHCYAYMIGPDKSCFRSSDDGEPSGTAGKPILNQILSKDVTNVCVIVVRYFGGIKLGVSGLINAYKTAAREALDNAVIVEKTVNEIYSLEFPYALMNDVMRVLKEEGLEQQNPRFEMDCYLEFSTRKNEAEKTVAKFKNIFGVTVSYIKTL
ncbi:MAG: YigZ family protein [Bacteroidales bacterium]|nr:YigZ family protein [Bacteroidales bacterium]MBR6272507.1 YigZ family protein [Bacteroidales bacterium]